MWMSDFFSQVKIAAAIMASFLPSSLAALNYKPLGPAIEQIARELVSVEIQSQLLGEEENRPPPSAVPSNTDTNVIDPILSTEIGRIIDDKWEDKRAAFERAMEETQKREAEQRETQRINDALQQVQRRISELEQVKAQAEKPTDNLCPAYGSFGRRRRMLEDAQKEATPSKEQFESLSSNVDSIKLDQDAMKKDTEANTQALQEMQGRLQILENSPTSTQANATIPDAVAAPTARAEEPAADVVGCDHEDLDALVAKTDDHDKRIEIIENVFTHLKPEDMWNFFLYSTEKFNEFDGYVGKTDNKLGEIENTQKQQADLLKKTTSKQKASAEQQQTQQKGASDKDISEFKEQVAAKDKEIVDLNAKYNKLAEDHAERGRQIDSLKVEADKSIAERKAQNARLDQLAKDSAEKDRQIASLKADTAAKTAKFDAEQKVQNDRLDMLEQLFRNMAATGRQFPDPNQQQPQFVPPQPSPAPQGNGPWTPATTPPNQASDPVPELDVQMEDGDELDSEMMDAPDQPPQPSQPSQPDQFPQPPHVPQQSQVPQPPQQYQQPPSEPFHQPKQPSTSTPRDTPMANAGPIFPTSNGNVGAAPKPQPMAGSQPFPSNGPKMPSSTTPTGSAPKPSRQHLGPVLPQPPSSGSVPSQPTPSTPAPVTPAAPSSQKGNLFAKSVHNSGAHNVNPNQFHYNAAPPVVNMPQIDWDAQMGKLQVNFDPPSDLDDDDDELLNPKGQLPQATAAPVTPSTGQTAAKISSPGNAGASSAAHVSGGSGSNAPAPPVANNAGPSSSTAGSSSTPAKPTPKPKKKPSLFIQPKPAATPSKPADVTSKAQSTQTPAASMAARRQAAFKNLYNTPASPQTTAPVPAAPMQPTGGESTFFIPGLTGAPNNSPFALKPKTPSSSPYTGQSRTHDTVESSSPVNVFLKEVVVVPEAKTGAAEASATEAGTAQPAKPEDNGDDICMSDSDSKSKAPEATEAPKPEVNPTKHIDPKDAPVAQKEDAMDIDRRLAKPKGRFQNMTPAQVQAHKDRLNKEEEWAAQERKLNAPAPKKPAGPEEDEVDYADPNDMNDEDVHTTVMVAPKKSMRPTKYTPVYFQKWKKSFCNSTFSTWDQSFVHNFRKHLDRMEQHDYSQDELVQKAGFPRQKKAYEKSQMMHLMDFWFNEVFMDALRVMRVEDGILDGFRRMFHKPVNHYFACYPADTI